MDDYLSKPINPDVLKETLRTWLCTYHTNAGDCVTEKNNNKDEPVEQARVDDIDEILWDKEDVLKRMRGKDKILVILIQSFQREMYQYIDSIEEHLENNDYPSAAQSAHGVKGVAANLSAIQLRELVARIERSCLDEEVEGLPELKEKLRPCYEKTLTAFQQYLDEMA